MNRLAWKGAEVHQWASCGSLGGRGRRCGDLRSGSAPRCRARRGHRVQAAAGQVLAFIKTRPQRFGVYFKDLINGATWSRDGDRAFPAASTVKVPIALYVDELVTKGELHWNDRLRYDRSLDFAEGAGVLQYDGIDGQTYSLRPHEASKLRWSVIGWLTQAATDALRRVAV